METPNLAPDPFSEVSEPQKKNNTVLIISIVLVLLLCCCCILGFGGWWLWTNGDTLSGTSMLLHTL